MIARRTQDLPAFDEAMLRHAVQAIVAVVRGDEAVTENGAPAGEVPPL